MPVPQNSPELKQRHSLPVARRAADTRPAVFKVEWNTGEAGGFDLSPPTPLFERGKYAVDDAFIHDGQEEKYIFRLIPRRDVTHCFESGIPASFVVSLPSVTKTWIEKNPDSVSVHEAVRCKRDISKYRVFRVPYAVNKESDVRPWRASPCAPSSSTFYSMQTRIPSNHWRQHAASARRIADAILADLERRARAPLLEAENKDQRESDARERAALRQFGDGRFDEEGDCNSVYAARRFSGISNLTNPDWGTMLDDTDQSEETWFSRDGFYFYEQDRPLQAASSVCSLGEVEDSCIDADRYLAYRIRNFLEGELITRPETLRFDQAVHRMIDIWGETHTPPSSCDEHDASPRNGLALAVIELGRELESRKRQREGGPERPEEHEQPCCNRISDQEQEQYASESDPNAIAHRLERITGNETALAMQALEKIREACLHG